MTPTPKVGLITGVNMGNYTNKSSKNGKYLIKGLKRKRMKSKKIKKKIYDGVDGVESNPANTGA